MENEIKYTDIVIIEDTVHKNEFKFKCMLNDLCVFAHDSNKGIEIIRSYFEYELGRESNNFDLDNRSNFQPPTKWINTTNKEKLYPRLYDDCMFFIDSNDSISIIEGYSRRMSKKRKDAMKRCLQTFMNEYKKEVKAESKKKSSIDRNFIKNSVTDRVTDNRLNTIIETAEDDKCIRSICYLIYFSEVFTREEMSFCDWVDEFYKAMCKKAPKTNRPSQFKPKEDIMEELKIILPQSQNKLNRYKRTKKS